jgi:hypothetical protein
MKKVLLLLAALTAALSLGATPASAVTDGEPDGEGHPYVGLMVAKDADGNPLWRCTGTLLSPTLFLTAGHCTEEPAVSVDIWFDSHLEVDPNYTSIANGGTGCANPEVTGYPCYGADATGTPYTHPDYDPNRFYYRDLGVVVLEEPVEMDEYGVLPEEDVLDALATQRGRQDVWFTAVGYGLQRINPVFVEAELTRMVAYPRLIQINVPGFTGDYSLLLTNNANTGGTCFGDSGGPYFIGDSNVLAGVTSFGINGNCAGTGGVFRLDRSWALDWLYGEFGEHL